MEQLRRLPQSVPALHQPFCHPEARAFCWPKDPSNLPQSRCGIEMLPISIDHLLALERLPMHHRDLFDRMLIAQSMEEGWPIITADPKFKEYPIRVIW
jgi:PIN domain nuclease of toxin-antitoxin system